MVTSEVEPRRGRGRPRTPGAEKRIIDAALEEYGEHGWSGFTMDGVARRAGVGKSTVYLRWQDKDALLTEAVSSASATLGAVDTGTMRGDLHALATNLFRYFREPVGWATLRVLVDAGGASQPLGQFAEAVSDVQIDYMERIVARAVERGEVPTGTSHTGIGEAVYGVVTMQTLRIRLEGRQLGDDEIDQRATALCDLVLDGVRG